MSAFKYFSDGVQQSAVFIDGRNRPRIPILFAVLSGLGHRSSSFAQVENLWWPIEKE